MERASFEQLKQGLPFYLECRGNNKFVTSYEDRESALHARVNDNEINDLCYFQFIQHETKPETYYLFTWKYRDKVSVMNEGWPLFPKSNINTRIWDHFSLHKKEGSEYINIKSEHPIAKDGPWISVVDEPKILRVAERNPHPDGWSDFLPYLVNQ